MRGVSRHRRGRRPRTKSVRRPVDPRERRRGDCRGHRRRCAADRDDPVQGAADRSADLAARRVSPHPGRATPSRARPTSPDPDGQEIKTEKQTFKLEVVAREIETPWGLAFLPDGRLLVTERAGKLRIIPKDKSGAVVTVTGTPKVWERQDAGLFDVEVHPQYAKNGWIYLAYAEPVPNYTPPPPPAEGAAPAAPAPGRGGRGPQTARHSVDDHDRPRQDQAGQRVDRSAGDLPRAARAVHDQQLALRIALHVRPAGASLLHDRRARRPGECAGSRRKPIGKIHRVNDDGSVPKDNPFVERAGALPTIWSYGHRNPQGLAWDPVTGKLWESEHGPAGRRRDQHHRARQELRLGRDHDGRPARHHQAQRAGDGAADRLLTRRRSRRAA